MLSPVQIATQAIEATLCLKFSGAYSLDIWGSADRHVVYKDGTVVLLEVEHRQKHPCTNVLIALASLVAVGDSEHGLPIKMARDPDLGGRFRYCRVVLGNDGTIAEGISELLAAVAPDQSNLRQKRIGNQ